MVWSALAFGIAFALLVVGLLGVILPAIPGVGFMWVVILVYAVLERFATIDPYAFVALTVLGLAGSTADLWMGQLGAKVSGASIWSTLASIAGALLGGWIGLLFAGIGAVPGAVIGSVSAVFLAEYLKHREWKPAWRATLGVMVGFTLSTVVQFCIGVAMLAIFVWQVMRG
jgi:uncharacterized protein YqgC (DUF456 family)